MKTIIKYLFVLPLILLGLESIAQNPVQIKGSMRYRNHAVDSMMATPSDTITPTGYFAARPNIVIKDDSVIYVWDVTLQKWRLPRVGSASITWADILGNPYDNPILADSLNVKQQAMPTGVQEEVITGAHTLLNLDSLLNANGYVKISDPIFDTLLSGTSDSLNFINGLYRVGNNVMSYYWQPMWNANRIQTKYVDATQPGNFTFLGWDSTNNVLRWMIPDSVALDDYYTIEQTDSAIAANAGGTPTLQQVTDAGFITNDGLFAYSHVVWDTDSRAVLGTGGVNGGGILQLKKMNSMSELTSGTNFGGFYIKSDNLPYYKFENGTEYPLISTGGGTPTLQQVLDAGSTLTSVENINLSTYGLSITRPSGFGLNLENNGFASLTAVVDANWDYGSDVFATAQSNMGYAGITSWNISGIEHKVAVFGDYIQFSATIGGSGTTLKFALINLPTFADDAAAATGGLGANYIYKTSTGELRIKL